MNSIAEWDRRYRTGDRVPGLEPVPLVVEWATPLAPGDALDLACGSGRNAAWLAERGWRVTAVDASGEALGQLVRRAPGVVAVQADLETPGTFDIGAGCWDLILMSYYLQRDLFARAASGLRPGGVLIAIALLDETGEGRPHRAKPGELEALARGLSVLRSSEGEGIAALLAMKR